jgi:threonine dehydratase
MTVIQEELLLACELAAKTVYLIDDQTAAHSYELPNGEGSIFLKREDASKIRSYKWRGAYNKLSACVGAGNRGPFVTTSAGNHAQGVALAAAALGVQATVFMPRSTPDLKQNAVRRHGGDFVDVRLVGDSFEQALAAAMAFASESNATILSAFDDLHVIAGQSTVAAELLRQVPGVEVIFVPVGGGGLASGISFLMKHKAPHVKVIGVEVRGQDSMSQSIREARQLSLGKVDRFCDGTAVATPGNLTWEVCRECLADTVVVSNEQVCGAIQALWEEERLVPEPSGAIALAGLLQASRDGRVDPHSQVCVAIVSGGNVDFRTLPMIVQRSQLALATRRFFRFEIEERNGSLIGLLDQFVEGINIVDFRYGKTGDESAAPVLGLSGSTAQFEPFLERLRVAGQSFEEVTENQATLYRIIAFRPDLTQHPCFLHIDFPDRPGALRELMREVSSLASICYFNFNDTGQAEGHALIGFDFARPSDREVLLKVVEDKQFAYADVDVSSLMGG